MNGRLGLLQSLISAYAVETDCIAKVVEYELDQEYNCSFLMCLLEK